MFGKKLNTCPACGKLYPKSGGCDVASITVNGTSYSRIRYGSSTEGYGPAFGKCVSCGVMPGRCHHWGCMLEKCPECDRTLASCACVKEIKEAGSQY